MHAYTEFYWPRRRMPAYLCLDWFSSSRGFQNEMKSKSQSPVCHHCILPIVIPQYRQFEDSFKMILFSLIWWWLWRRCRHPHQLCCVHHDVIPPHCCLDCAPIYLLPRTCIIRTSPPLLIGCWHLVDVHPASPRSLHSWELCCCLLQWNKLKSIAALSAIVYSVDHCSTTQPHLQEDWIAYMDVQKGWM